MNKKISIIKYFIIYFLMTWLLYPRPFVVATPDGYKLFLSWLPYTFIELFEFPDYIVVTAISLLSSLALNYRSKQTGKYKWYEFILIWILASLVFSFLYYIYGRYINVRFYVD